MTQICFQLLKCEYLLVLSSLMYLGFVVLVQFKNIELGFKHLIKTTIVGCKEAFGDLCQA